MKGILAAAFCSAFLLSCQRVGNDQIAANQIAEKWIAAWNSHSVHIVVPLFTDDVFYEDVAFGRVNHGSAELRKFTAFFFDAVPDLKLELASSTIKDGHGTIEWLFSGTDRAFTKLAKCSPYGVSV